MNGTVAAPVIDGRRRAALLAMLEQLVPACLPDWRAGGGQGDVAQAILSLAAGLEAFLFPAFIHCERWAR